MALLLTRKLPEPHVAGGRATTYHDHRRPHERPDSRGHECAAPLRRAGPRHRRPRPGHPQPRPRRWAMAAASTRPAAPSLARMLETCTPTVLGLMNSAWAIWRLLRPAATSASTSASRGVRPSCAAGVDALAAGAAAE